ncbi:MAG: hypothetical protein HQ541_10055 [Mariniphaga sp.]|nr:hypothetical protein [Mariniphaga sp.]
MKMELTKEQIKKVEGIDNKLCEAFWMAEESLVKEKLAKNIRDARLYLLVMLDNKGIAIEFDEGGK